MFYSKDLLGKKSPLGNVWIAAHGKKLGKQKILQVNIGQSCKHIMNPEVPQALRMQAILVGGVVIIYHKQQGFLLEDCTEMLKRMRVMADAAAMPGATLVKKNNKAKVEAITMPAEDMLADQFHMDDIFPNFSTQLNGPGGSEGKARDAPQISEELFIMPTMPEGGDTPRSRDNGRQRGLLDLEQPGFMPVSLEGLERFDLNMDMPETFEVPDVDMPGMEIFGYADQPAPPSPGPMPMPDGGELFPVPDDLQAAIDAEQPRSQTPEPTTSKDTTSRGAAPRTQQRKKKTGRKVPVMDAPDAVQILGKEYREWTMDRSDLLVRRPRQRSAPSHKSPLVIAPATAGLLGGSWPAELMDVFNRNATLGTSLAKSKATGAGAAMDGDELLEEQERQLDEQRYNQGMPDLGAGLEYGDMPDMPIPEAGEDWLGAELEAARAAAAGEEGAVENGFRRRTKRAASQGTEDIETERLRAALNNTPGSALDAFYLGQGLTPADYDPLAPTNVLTTRNKRTRSALRPESERALSEKSSGPRAAHPLSDLGDELLGADMAAMLPVVDEHEEFLGDAEALAAGPASRKRQRQQGPAGGASGGAEGGSGPTNGTGTYGTVSQFELLEDSGPGTQLLGPAEALNRSTVALIGLLRGKFNALESQGSGPSEISLFDMAAKLNRSEAAKLFAQILVTKSNDIIDAKQDEPYGDIILTRGSYL